MSPPQAFVTRFAPSPTGRLHLGHAYSALVGHEIARRASGRFLLRIEDIDKDRCRPEFEAAVYEDLAWLGLSWERPVRRQSDHLQDYQAAVGRLQEAGLLYRCFRTRKQLLDDMARAPHGEMEAARPGPLSPDAEADAMTKDQPFAWRLSLEAAERRLGRRFHELTARRSKVCGDGVSLDPPLEETIDLSATGDVIVARKGIGVSYHLAVVVDDASQKVSHVLRGEDLRDAVPVQRLLQALLDLPPPTYAHHRLILDADGRRLAKRSGSTSLADLRASGVDPHKLKMSLGFPFEPSP